MGNLSKPLLGRIKVSDLFNPAGGFVEGTPRGTTIPSDARLPERADVVVIGGGIIGVTIVLELAERGISAALCEKGEIAGEASSRAVGQASSAGLDHMKMPLLQRAKHCWLTLNARVEADTGYRRQGDLILLETEAEVEQWRTWIDENRAFEPEARILGRRELRNIADVSDRFIAAFHNPTDGHAEPMLAAPAIAEAARRAGAALLTRCAVRGVETVAGRLSAVVTERGTIKTETAILAGGCWSSLFCQNLGFRLPELNVFASASSMYGPVSLPGTGSSSRITWRKQADGGYTITPPGGVAPIVPASFRYAGEFMPLLEAAPWEIKLSVGRPLLHHWLEPRRWRLDAPSPFERVRILQPIPDLHAIARVHADAHQAFKGFDRMKAGSVWTGALVTTPDNVPTMSAIENLPGFYLASGFTYGITMAPAVGPLMADLVTGKPNDFDYSSYRFERFSDGTKLHVRH